MYVGEVNWKKKCWTSARKLCVCKCHF